MLKSVLAFTACVNSRPMCMPLSKLGTKHTPCNAQAQCGCSRSVSTALCYKLRSVLRLGHCGSIKMIFCAFVLETFYFLMEV